MHPTGDGFTVCEQVKKMSPALPTFGDAWVITDALGNIQDISVDAARVLNLSQRGARGRNLATFFVDNRPKLMAELLRAADGLIIERRGTLQPRDRKPMHVHLDVSAVPSARGERVYLRWLISPETR